MLQFYAEITQILRNLRNRYALLRRLRTVTHRYADGNLLMVCTCPHNELDWTDVSYPYRDTESVKREVSAARSEHLDDDGHVKDQHIQEVN